MIGNAVDDSDVIGDTSTQKGYDITRLDLGR